MKNEIKQTWHFNQSPQAVWEYLTIPDLMEQWLGKTDFKPIVGHKFKLIGKEDCHTYCEVLAVEPFTKLSYSWQINSAKDNSLFNSKVEWKLIPKDKGTELQLVHSGFTDIEDYTGHNHGWTILVPRIIELLNTSKMASRNYTATIEVAQSPEAIFKHINDVSQWWSKDFEGSSTKLNDEFVIHHPNAHYSKQKLVEVIPYKKIVWLVSESNLTWLKEDKQEWTNTKMIFELSPLGDKTLLRFTHEGLVPEKECYARCEQGWNMVIKDWLFNFITIGKTI